MTLQIDDLEVEIITDIEAQCNGKVIVTLIGADLADVLSADEIVTEYGADVLLDAIGGLEDWIYNSGIEANKVVEWVRAEGYFVERN